MTSAVRRRIALTVTLLAAMLAALTAPAAVPAASAQSGDYQQTLDIAFPTVSSAHYSDTYDACRSGCDRKHKATDLMAPKHSPVYATVDGVICRINDEEVEDSYGRHLTLCGDDDRRYRYLHLNNDTPGTDDGQADLGHVYAPGIHDGSRVARGQHLGWLGDSGNAEHTGSHVHLDIFDDNVVDPYGDNRINPYPSLRAAEARGEYPDGSAAHVQPPARIAGTDRIGTAVKLSAETYEQADTVLLAPSTVPADALTAAPLAAKVGGPVLVTHPSGLDGRVAAEIGRLGADTVIVVGGRLSGPVAGQLADDGLTVDAIVGQTRFDTAARVADRVWGDAEADPAPDGGLAGDGLPDGFGPTADGPSAFDADDPARFRLAVSTSEDRSDPVDLDGATVATDTSMFLVGDDLSDVDGVAFFVGEVDGHPDAYEQHEPYDFPSSGRQVHVDELPAGPTTLHAVVVLDDDSYVTVSATFDVVSDAVPARRALLALGQHPDPSREWPDALMAAHLGAATGTPVLLAGTTVLPAETQAVLEGADGVTVVGGPAALNDAVVDAAGEASGTSPQRLAGEDRYLTGLQVAERALEAGTVDVDHVWAATGGNWPDALAAGPAAAHAGNVLLLVDGGGAYHRGLGSWLADRSDRIDEGTVVGGPAAMSDTAARLFALDYSA